MATPPSEPTIGEQLRHAGQCFALGRFETARPLYEAALARDPQRLEVAVRLAMLALLDGRLAEARRHAERAVELAPDLPLPCGLLAEAAYRAHDFARAAECYQDLGRPGLAAKARRLAETGAYRLEPRAGDVRLPFMAPGSLPVVPARIDGREVHLAVDTAAGELLVDRAMAGVSGGPLGGSESIAFAGGRTAMVEHGIVGCLELGSLSLVQVPCQLLDLTGVFAPFLDLPIHGVIGLGVLQRFAVALDFSAPELRLAWPAAGAPPAGGGQRLWIAAGHYLVTTGQVGDGRRVMAVIDTGMSGVDCAVARPLGESVALSPEAGGEIAGQGGGGVVTGQAVRVSRMCVGELCRTDVRAALLPRLALERRLGFQVAGLIASDFFRDAVLTLDFERMELGLT